MSSSLTNTTLLEASPHTPESIKELITAASVFDSTYASKPTLNRHQNNAYSETLKAYDGGHDIIEAHVLANNASFNPLVYPTGQITKHKQSAAVSPVSLSPEMFKCLVICPIIPDTKQILKDGFFESKLDKLESSVKQFADESPINGATRDSDNSDYNYWSEELGETGWVGILKKKDNARYHSYYVAACVSVPVLGSNIIQSLSEPECDVTWKDITDPTYQRFDAKRPFMYWREGARRNACRVAARAAESIGVVIGTTDEYGTLVDPNGDASKKVTADPQHVQYISDISSSDARGFLKCGTMYSHCAPVTTINSKYHFVSVSPLAGLVGVHLEPTMSKKNNTEAGALPTTTGRKTATADIDISEIADEDIEDMNNVFTWEGKKENPEAFNDRLHHDAYNAFDDIFIENGLVSQGWNKALGYDKYETVIMKIPSRKPRPDVGV